MAESKAGFVRQVELRLLRCTLLQAPPCPPPPSHMLGSDPLIPLVERLVASIEQGDYRAVLSDTAARLPFAFADAWEFDDSADCPARFYEEVDRSVASFLLGAAAASDAWLHVLNGGLQEQLEEDAEYKCALLMCVGVAALLAFTQQNVTGPIGKFSPFPLPVGSLTEKWGGNDGGKWDVWASSHLASVGSHVQGKCSLLQYIVYAEIIFRNIKDLAFKKVCQRSNQSVSWWLSRIYLLQQRILDELSSSLLDRLQQYMKDTIFYFGEPDKVSNYWGSLLSEGEGSTITSASYLEAGIAAYKYGHDNDSREHIKCAERYCRLQLSVTGILGYRTIHQVDAKPQLVLVADTDQQVNGERSAAEIFQAQNSAVNLDDEKSSIAHENADSCDILRAPRLLLNGNASANGNAAGFSSSFSLTALQQAVVLAQCLYLVQTNRDDELSKWQMAPYIEFIDSQHHTYYTIRTFCDILRIRWESTRSHTKQRSLLMMEKLVQLVDDALPVAAQRIQLAFGVYIPTIPALRKEYGELLVGCGLVGEALKIFENLELWDNLIFCYRLLDKRATAIDLIKAQLSGRPDDPRLWCSLGDVTSTDAYYEKALEVSNNKSARAMRCLARSAYNRKDFKTCVTFWETALCLNSLYPDGWFSLGMAALKENDIEKAVDAYTRAVQIDPDNGEAWNNIACLHMKREKKAAAFLAFKEAIKYKRSSWEVWDNFSMAALNVGNLSQTLEAVKMVLNLTNNKRLDVKLLAQVMNELEERSPYPALSSFDTHEAYSDNHLADSCNKARPLESVPQGEWEYDHLLDMLGNILQQAVRNGGDEDIWGLYARWHKINGNLVTCAEALLKQVRSLQGSGLLGDEGRFKRFARASFHLCKVYLEIASSTGSRRELVAAEMHLRSSVKQADKFSSTGEYRALNDCLVEVRKLLDASSAQVA